MDLDKIEKDLSDLTIDFYLEKDCSKYLPIINEHLHQIALFLNQCRELPETDLSVHLMKLGYLFYSIKEHIVLS
jgi:hypothetical protein